MATGNGALYHDEICLLTLRYWICELYDKAITLTDLSDNPLPAMVLLWRTVNLHCTI